MIADTPTSPINLSTETLVSVAQAARKIPARRGQGSANPATIWRWIKFGARSASGQKIKLQACRIGGGWVTSLEAITRFSQALADGADVEPIPLDSSRKHDRRTPHQRQKDSERAGAKLTEAGI